MKRWAGGWVVGGLALALVCFVAVVPAQAFSCVVTGQSGGNPGGEDVFTCSDLIKGDELTVTVDQTVGPDALLATATITIFDILDGQALIDVVIANQSSGENRIVSFGLAIEPEATMGDLDGGTVFTTFSTSNFPGFQLVEFCAAAGSNCAGGGAGGLDPGGVDSFRFMLENGYVEGGSIELSQFAFKFQGGAEGASYEKPGTPENGGGLIQVSTPGGLVLLGSGLLGLLFMPGVMARLRRN